MAALRTRLRAQCCRANLEHLQTAKARWASDNRKSGQERPTPDDLVPAYLSHFPDCPDDGQYILGDVSTPPRCTVGNRHTPTPDGAHVLSLAAPGPMTLSGNVETASGSHRQLELRLGSE